jgi:hypothetical protein
MVFQMFGEIDILCFVIEKTIWQSGDRGWFWVAMTRLKFS